MKMKFTDMAFVFSAVFLVAVSVGYSQDGIDGEWDDGSEMDEPIDSLEPVDDASIEVSESPLVPAEEPHVEVPGTSAASTVEISTIVVNPVEEASPAETDPFLVAASIMASLVDEPNVDVPSIVKIPVEGGFSLPIYEMFDSGKMRWTAKMLKLAELEGDSEKAAKLRVQLADMMRNWILEQDSDELPHD